jgi:glycosyltransferase involved in cell wall biosynthesis
MKKVTVLIPCYNEEESIALVIQGLPKGVLKAHGYNLEVVVIDNNSKDKTTEVALAAGAKVIFEGKQGKGNAIRTGFYSISEDTDYVVMLDGDHTYRPEEIIRLLEPLNSGFANVIIGSRLGGRISAGSMKTFNRIGNWGYSHLVRYSYRVNVTDVLTGYFAWTRGAVEKLRPHLVSDGFAIEMEMITKLARLGEDIYSVPISYHARAGESSLHPVRDGIRILRMYMNNLSWAPKPVRTERIAFVSDAVLPYNRGGKEKRLYEVSRRLISPNREVHIYTMKWWDGPNVIMQDGVYLHAISRLYPLYINGRRSTREALMFGLATFKLVFENFDTLDVDSMPFFPLFSARIVSWIRRKPLYSTWHEVTDLSSWQAYIGTLNGIVAWCVERLAMHSADTIISVSKHTTLRLRSNGFKKRIVTVPLGVDLANIYNINPSAQKSDVIFVGRLIAHKNVDLLIRAIAIAKVEYPNIVTKIIGNGPEKPRLTRLIKQLKLEDNVTLVGIVEKDNDLYGLMKASKMFVLPSIREGFSVVALEANAAGIPVITTNHPDNAARELVTNGVNGYVVEPSAEAIAERIITILENGKTMKPKKDIKQYDWDSVAENIKKALAV